MAIERITPEEAQKKLESDQGYVYLDVRTVDEFAGGHVPGARNIPVLEKGPAGMTPNADFVTVAAANFPKDQKIITGCLRGGRSSKAAQLLQAAGFTNVTDMRGGFDGEIGPDGQIAFPGWSRRGLPVATEAPAETTYESLAAKRQSPTP